MTLPVRADDRVPVRRGRPPAARTKERITVRLDPEIVAHFRAQGRGWQTRLNAVLRRAIQSGIA